MYIKKTERMKMFQDMVLLRIFEERVKSLVEEGELTGPIHLYTGEEAVAVGVCSALEKDDVITSTHRSLGHLLAKGGDVNKLMAELGGRITGYCKGKGGSMNMAAMELGFLGANSMVGQGVPIALGAAFASKYKGTDRVVAAFFGDGASNEGVIHEAMNMASVWNLPIIFVCENNQYAVSTNILDSIKIEDIADRAQGYGMVGVVVDGMDVLNVYQAAKEAVNRAREGKGPTLIECKTYRYCNHSSDVNVPSDIYRKDAEVSFYLAMDPIQQLKFDLKSERVPEEVFDNLIKSTKRLVDQAVKFMQESPYPEPEQAYEDAYEEIHETMPLKGWS